MTLKILSIDDSLTIRTILTQSLENSGLKVITAIDGEDGLKKFQQEVFDMVITDINMPNLDGFGVIKGIRSGDHNKTIPILVLTTESSKNLKERARELGATGWIVKPFSEDSLISVIKKVRNF